MTYRSRMGGYHGLWRRRFGCSAFLCRSLFYRRCSGTEFIFTAVFIETEVHARCGALISYGADVQSAALRSTYINPTRAGAKHEIQSPFKTPHDCTSIAYRSRNAVRTLIQWAGDNPRREGLRGTPARVVRAYEEWFAGYFEDPREYLQRTFEEVAGYDEMVLLRDIRFESHCEHHMAPIIGRVHIGYLPRKRIVGISKLVRLVDVYAKRMQVQEKMTAEIAACLNSVLKPAGVAVVVEGAHECMTTRGVHRADVTMVTSRMLGVFRTNFKTRQEFFAAIKLKHGIDDGSI